MTPLNRANLWAIYWTWCASSLVFTITIACIWSFFTSISFKIGMRYAAVLPVPFLALAIIGLLCLIKGIDYSWIGVGLLNPQFAKASKIFSYNSNSANDWYFVASISSSLIWEYFCLLSKVCWDFIILLSVWVWVHHFYFL